MGETVVLFSLSKNIALIGEFEGKSWVIADNFEQVSAINSKIISFAVSQIYSPNLCFHFIDYAGKIRQGSEFIDYISNINNP